MEYEFKGRIDDLEGKIAEICSNCEIHDYCAYGQYEVCNEIKKILND